MFRAFIPALCSGFKIEPESVIIHLHLPHDEELYLPSPESGLPSDCFNLLKRNGHLFFVLYLFKLKNKSSLPLSPIIPLQFLQLPISSLYL